MFQYLGAGIAMMIFRLHSALSQQDKLDSCVTATLKIVISMSLATCALPTKYWCQISTYYVHVFIQLRTSYYYFFYHLVVAF